MNAKQRAINLRIMRSLIKEAAAAQDSHGEVKKSTLAINRMGFNTIRKELSERDNSEYDDRYKDII